MLCDAMDVSQPEQLVLGQFAPESTTTSSLASRNHDDDDDELCSERVCVLSTAQAVQACPAETSRAVKFSFSGQVKIMTFFGLAWLACFHRRLSRLRRGLRCVCVDER